MKSNPAPFISRLLALTLLTVSIAPAWAIDPPDSTINPVSGVIEISDTVLQGGNYNIRHIADPDNGDPILIQMVSAGAVDDLGARLTNSPNGDTFVVWWRDGATDEVLVRRRSQSTSSWEDEFRVSEAGTDSRNPEIMDDGEETWVAFESDEGLGGTGISARGVRDDPDPVTLTAMTTFTGNIDIRMHLDSGHFWISWIDDDCDVGWSEYDSTNGTWSVAAYESCDGDTEGDARSRIRTEVLGL